MAYVFTPDDNKRLLLDESKLLDKDESINTNAYKAIVNYIKDDNVKYGILLNGEWGCGKTYFANRIKDSFIDKNSVWIISLNGITKKKKLMMLCFDRHIQMFPVDFFRNQVLWHIKF